MFARTHTYTEKAQTPSVAYRKSRPSLTYQTINNNETYADMTNRLPRIGKVGTKVIPVGIYCYFVKV